MQPPWNIYHVSPHSRKGTMSSLLKDLAGFSWDKRAQDHATQLSFFEKCSTKLREVAFAVKAFECFEAHFHIGLQSPGMQVSSCLDSDPAGSRLPQAAAVGLLWQERRPLPRLCSSAKSLAGRCHSRQFWAESQLSRAALGCWTLTPRLLLLSASVTLALKSH